MKGTLCFFISLFSLYSYAGSQFVPIQERAQGQSLTGANLLNDSLHSNPASSSFTQIYSVEGIYNGSQTFGISVLDTKTSHMGGSLGYFRYDTPFSESPTHGVKLGLMGRLAPRVGVGATGKIIWGDGVSGDSENLKDVDVGVLVNLDSLRLGATIRNVFGGEENLDMVREYAVGGRIDWEQTLFFSASAVSTFEQGTPYQYGLGAEYVSPHHFAVKGGYRFLPDDSLSFWSTGVSLISPKVSVHYVLEIPNQSEASLEHTLGMTMLL